MTDHTKKTEKFISHSEAETEAYAAALARRLPPGTILTLEGDLGAGKTVFARGFARGLGITEPVSSPTYTIVQEYALPGGGGRLYHLDLYRINSPGAALDFGVDEFFAGALALGAEGFIGSTYNYGAKLYFRIWDEFKKGNWSAVRTGMNKVCDGVDLLVRHGGLAAGKAMMNIQGIDCGAPRPPLMPLPPETIREICQKAGRIYQE